MGDEENNISQVNFDDVSFKRIECFSIYVVLLGTDILRQGLNQTSVCPSSRRADDCPRQVITNKTVG